MNVMIIGMSDGYGGTERFILSQIEYRHRNDLNIWILNDRRCRNLAYEDKYGDLGMAGICTPTVSEKTHPFKFMKDVGYFLKSNSIDAIIVNVNSTRVRHVLVLHVAKKNGVKIRIVHSHTSSAIGRKAELNHLLCAPFVRSNVSGLITKRLACSQEAGEFEFGRQSFKVIRNGVNVDRFSYSSSARQKIRAELGLSCEVAVFLHVGRISYPKNTAFLVKMFFEYAKKNGGAVLLIVGGIDAGDREYNEVQKALNASSNSQCIMLLGVRHDVSALMSAADVFLLPSRYEGFPIVSVESQCSGLMNVVSDKIPKDVDLSGLVSFVPLEVPISQWCDALEKAYVKSKTVIRVQMANSIKQSGFDIQTAADEYWKCVTEA